MDQNRRRIDLVRDPAFVGDLAAVDLAELRRRRGLVEKLDSELSYYRRILHGRMDLLSFEQRRRAGTEKRSLIEALPDILADPGGEGRAEVPRELPIETPEFAGSGRRTIDHVLDDDFLARLPSIEDAELDRIHGILSAAEQEISTQRRTVHEASDAVSEELTRRYREGLADVDELLGSR